MYTGSNFPPILAVAGVVINEKGEVLLNKREKHVDKGKWQLVAGYVEYGEQLVDAVKRLVKEKVFIINPTAVEYSGKYYDQPGRHPGTFCVPLLFTVHVSEDTANSVPVNENLKWFTPEKMEKLEFALDNRQMLVDLGILKK